LEFDGELEEERGPRTWREDALSIFLLVAAVVLGAMYMYDRWQRNTLDEQIERAEQIEQSFEVDGANCTVASAGLRGKVLVFACAGLEPAAIADIAAGLDGAHYEHFDEVAFRGAGAQLRCPAAPSAWPDECREEATPEVTAN
jgi:hypothetical protein